MFLCYNIRTHILEVDNNFTWVLYIFDQNNTAEKILKRSCRISWLMILQILSYCTTLTFPLPPCQYCAAKLISFFLVIIISHISLHPWTYYYATICMYNLIPHIEKTMYLQCNVALFPGERTLIGKEKIDLTDCKSLDEN